MPPILIATMRNEGPFILEWVAYHRLIGFGRVLVCSNDCDDGSPVLLDALAEEGLIEHIPCAPGPDEQPQLFAYAAAERRLRDGGVGWAMVLDADEFLNVHIGEGRLADLIEAGEDATAVLVNWRVFGSSGHERWSPDPVTARFTRAAAVEHGVNWSYKTLFDQFDAYHCPLLPHGPGFARDEAVAAVRPVDGGGRTLGERYARSAEFLQSEPGTVSWRLAQVNHYNTRSWEDYVVKHRRGGGLAVTWEREAGWAVWNRNEEEDRSIQRHLPGVRRLLAEWRAVPAIAAAERDARAGYADDWVDRDLVAVARAGIGREQVGGLGAHGGAVDVASGRAAPFPLDGFAFHELCGSSTVARVDPAGAREVDRDPHAVLGSHGDWARSGWPLAMLDVWGAYLVGTGQSHSEDAGPHAEWRRGFAEAVRRTGQTLDGKTMVRFGLSEETPALIAQAAASAGVAPASELGPAAVSVT